MLPRATRTVVVAGAVLSIATGGGGAVELVSPDDHRPAEVKSYAGTVELHAALESVAVDLSSGTRQLVSD